MKSQSSKYSNKERGELMSLRYNYSKLTGKIIEVFETRDAFAIALGITKESVTLKLKGKTPWKQVEIDKTCALLNLDKGDIGLYFFTLEV